MAYNDTPLPTDLISDSQSEIRENFQLLEDSQVVDEGSTSDGDYIRYENGWQICISPITQISINNTLSSGATASTFGDSFTWTFPQSFISNPAGSAELVDRSFSYGVFAGMDKIEGTTDATIRGYHLDGETGTMDVIGIVIGRWK